MVRLERVHSGDLGAVDVAKLRIARVHVEGAPVLEPEGAPAVVDRGHLRALAVDEPVPGVVAGPADAVADAKLNPLALVDLDPARARGEPPGLPGDSAPVPAGERHRAGRVVDAGDAKLLAPLDPEALVGR